MEHMIENEYLRLSVSSRGAEMQSLFCKLDGTEHLWQGDPQLWGYRAPLLFPWCGRQVGGGFRYKGKSYAAPPHGFAREMEHELLVQKEDELLFLLKDSEQSLERWPFSFRLLVGYQLRGTELIQTVRVENSGDEPMRFGLGFHPGFALPFDREHIWSDYELRFDREESPICLDTPKGTVSDHIRPFLRCTKTVELTEHLFADDSYLMTGLRSDTLGLYEKGSGRGLRVDISSFPYCLIWSKPGEPRFVCIEPWHSLPSFDDDPQDWEQRSCAARLMPGESWQSCLKIEILR